MAHTVSLGAGISGMPKACELREKLPREHRHSVACFASPCKPRRKDFP